MNKFLRFFYLLALPIFISSCNSGDEANSIDEELRTALRQASPNGTESYFQLPESNDFANIPQDPQNPITAAKVSLGKLLFHETGLSVSPHK